MNGTRQERNTGTCNGNKTAIAKESEVQTSTPQAAIIVALFSGSAGLLALLIAFLGADPLTEAQQAVFDNLLSVFGLGAVVIIGLVSNHKIRTNKSP